MDVGGELAGAPADLDQAQAQRVQLQPLTPRAHQPAAQGVQQAGGCPVQQPPHLIGQKAVTREAVGEAGRLQILDPVLGLAAIGVPGIERGGGSVRVVTTKRELIPLASVSALMMTRRATGQEPAW